MIKRINNKGYMLVEIILASALAFGLAYFILDLTIKLKNKNDDLLVETLVTTDMTIITNRLMEYAIDEGEEFTCKVENDGKKITYTDKNGNVDTITYVNEYTDIGKIDCINELGKINIPLDVKQMESVDYDVVLDYKYEIDDRVEPECSMSVSGTKIIVTFKDNDYGSGPDIEKVKDNSTDWTFASDSSATRTINKNGDYIFNVYDMSGNSFECKLNVKGTTSYSYVCGQSPCGSYPCGTDCSSCPPDDYGSHGWVCGCSIVYCTSYCDDYCTGYKCSSGYTKINNTYCYKVT